MKNLMKMRKKLKSPLATKTGGTATYGSTPTAISAASILAKTTRDAWMCALHQRHPLYGFDRHMGYPTRQHIAALKAHGPISEHRRSFRPVREVVTVSDGATGYGPAAAPQPKVPFLIGSW